MGSSSGSIILTAILSPKSERRVAAFLRERSKHIAPERVNTALQNLPLVLSRNVGEETAQKVIATLRELGAQATFLPSGPAEESWEDWQPEQLQGAAATQAAPEPEPMPVHRGNEPEVKLVELSRSGKPARLQGPLRRIFMPLLCLAALFLAHFLIQPQAPLLTLFFLPTLLAAANHGRKPALLCSGVTIALIFLLASGSLGTLAPFALQGPGQSWLQLLAWGMVLLALAQVLGSLRDRFVHQTRGQWNTLHGLLLILEHCMCMKDHALDHSQRVTEHVTTLAEELGLDQGFIGSVRSAARLHGIARFKVSRHLMARAATEANAEAQQLLIDPDSGTAPQTVMQGPLGRIMPMLLGLLERFDGSGDRRLRGGDIPLGARILKVADSYDNLTSGRNGNSPLSPFEAISLLREQAGSVYDPVVVDAMIRILEREHSWGPSLLKEIEQPRPVADHETPDQDYVQAPTAHPTYAG